MACHHHAWQQHRYIIITTVWLDDYYYRRTDIKLVLILLRKVASECAVQTVTGNFFCGPIATGNVMCGGSVLLTSKHDTHMSWQSKQRPHSLGDIWLPEWTNIHASFQRPFVIIHNASGTGPDGRSWSFFWWLARLTSDDSVWLYTLGNFSTSYSWRFGRQSTGPASQSRRGGAPSKTFFKNIVRLPQIDAENNFINTKTSIYFWNRLQQRTGRVKTVTRQNKAASGVF